MMLALIVILTLLVLAVILTVSYFPRFKKPFVTERKFQFETAEEIAPKYKIKDAPEFKIEALENPPSQYEVPYKYNEDKMALLVRDPEWLFAYWEISTSTHDKILSEHHDLFNQSTYVLRVYNITDTAGAPSFFDISLAENSTRCHIHVQLSDNKFYVVVGRKKDNGEFIPILYSNVVLTPRSAVSPIFDKDWLPPFEYAHLLYKDGLGFSSYKAAKERND